MTSPKKLEPGLSVRYYYPFELNIDYLPKGEEALLKGVAGKPILWLNHKFGKGEVFDSGRKQLVGMIMNGFINFPEPGSYRIKAKSNDGIRIIVDEKTVVDDPKGHADRFKTSLEFQIPEPGWYPLVVKYFQRKGTATIEVYWKIPGSEDFIIIPAKAYGHIPPGTS